MKVVLNNCKPICFFRLEVGNPQQLVDYFNRLSPESKNRFGFRTLGEFEHNGKNMDMILEL